jgi:hypothetical protein
MPTAATNSIFKCRAGLHGDGRALERNRHVFDGVLAVVRIAQKEQVREAGKLLAVVRIIRSKEAVL